MKRLTVEHWQNLDPWECCGQDNYCMRPNNKPGGCRNGCIVPKLYTRLPGLVVVKYVDPKYWGGKLVHVEAGG